MTPASTHVGHVVTHDAVLTIVRGEIDFATNHHLNPAIDEAVSRGLDLVVDLREVPFIDSSTARLFARTAAVLREQGEGRTVRLLDVQPVVSRLLKILELGYLIDRPAA
ncbi:MAG TPA: STAS domain-containing protein [Mycobacteriales bacterium]|nr:STAS domain-containing protein [Mycobacteriales bacterium]